MRRFSPAQFAGGKLLALVGGKLLALVGGKLLGEVRGGKLLGEVPGDVAATVPPAARCVVRL